MTAAGSGTGRDTPDLWGPLDAVQAATGNLIAVINLQETRILYLSPSVEALLGLRREDLLQEGLAGLARLFPPGPAEGLTELLERLATTADATPSEPTPQRLRHRDGSWRPFQIQALPLKATPESPPHRILLLAREVPSGDTEATYRVLFENTGCASIVDEEDTTIVLANGEWERLTQVPRGDQEGRMSWVPFVHPEDRPRLLEIHHLRRENPQQAPSAFEVRLVNREGEVRHMVCHVAMIPGSHRSVGTFMDVTELRTIQAERQALQERLHHAEKLEAIGQLAGGIAHDFNNQLGAMQGFAELLQDRLTDPDLRRFAGNIATSCQRTSGMTRKLLAFARKGTYLSVPVDVHELVGEVLQLLQHSLDKRILLQHALDAERATVLGDANQIQNALMNLAVNARDAMPEGGILSFRSTLRTLDQADCQVFPYEVAPGTYLCLQVADTGCGMTEEVKQHLFEPFFTTKAMGKGTGLGLASIYGTVKGHQGFIQVESEPGQGTRFEVCLPLAQARTSVPERLLEPSSPRRSARILVAEDEELVGEMLVDMLQAGGYEPTWKRDGWQAVQHYREHWRDYDLVILDMMMPHLGGRDAFREMKAINPAIKALIASGFSQEGDAQGVMDEGAAGFLQKPFRLQEMRSTIQRVLEDGRA